MVDFTYDLGGIILHVTARERPSEYNDEPPTFDTFDTHYDGYDDKKKKKVQIGIELDSISDGKTPLIDRFEKIAAQVWAEEQDNSRREHKGLDTYKVRRNY